MTMLLGQDEETKPPTFHEIVDTCAYRIGLRAGFAGKTFESNPFDGFKEPYSDRWSEMWQSGFRDAGRRIKMAYMDGKAARDKGIDTNACPHPESTFMRSAWIIGHSFIDHTLEHQLSQIGD